MAKRRRWRDRIIRAAIPLLCGPLVTVAALAYLDRSLREAGIAGRAPTILDFGRKPGEGAAALVVAPRDGDSLPPTVRTGAAVNDPLFTRRDLAPPLDFDVLYRRVTVLAATRFRVVVDGQAQLVRFAGIVGPRFADGCTAPDGSRWKCGARARAELARLIGSRAVGCRDLVDEGEDGQAADCYVGRRSIAEWLVGRGWADPERADDPRFAALAETARREGRGRFGEPSADRPTLGRPAP